MSEIVNRVESSGLITINLEEEIPSGDRVFYDIADNLWQGLALKEKDFRQFIKDNDWSVYQDKLVAIGCTADAIVPTWAYMLLAQAMKPYAAKVGFGNIDQLENQLAMEWIAGIQPEDYRDKRIVIKGCGEKNLTPEAYVRLTELLTPVVKSLMFGEPCSTVPVYKRPKD